MPLDITNWKTPANIIANVIVASIPEFYSLGTNMFIGMMPDAPDDCVAIMDTGGGLQDSVNAIDDVSLQIFSRNKLYQIGYNLQNVIKATIQSLDPIIFSDEVVIGVWVKSNIAFIGKDESDRFLFSSNYRVMIDTQKDSNRMKQNDNYLDGGNAESFAENEESITNIIDGGNA